LRTTDTERRAGRGWIVLVLALIPALAAILWIPGFVTQDGPAHLYNSHILLESFRPDSPFRDVYQVKWQPLPNWAGHLGLVGLMAVGVPPRDADRLMLAATLVGFAASLFWLRTRVAGVRGSIPSAILCALLAMNLPWLFGFTSFLLGASLFPVTLGTWWTGRRAMGWSRAAAISGLLVLGYFAHLVSLGLTAVGLVFLCAFDPNPRRPRRWAWTLTSLLPLVPLGLVYRGLMRGGGGIEPLWMELKDPLSLESWKAQLGWVDPLTLGSRYLAPFVERAQAAFLALTPVLWVGLGLAAMIGQTVLGRRNSGPLPPGGGGLGRWGSAVEDDRLVTLEHCPPSERRGWVALAALLLFGGLIGPDTLGVKHGNYLSQRVVLLGLAALVPALDLGTERPLGKFGSVALAVALALQSAFVWDYGVRSDRLVGQFLKARPLVGRNKRVGTLLLDLRQRYRANPLLHIDNLLGIGTGNVIWNNYEAAHYYFPVQARGNVPHPPPLAFERVSLLDDPAFAARRSALWETLLAEHRDEIDVVVVWGEDASGLDEITGRWFEPADGAGKIRVWRRER
jgi:hypothetical protein